MGGYIMAFTEAAGFKVPHDFDFKVPGVTSISCDPHKYCRGPKGCSVLMFRTKELRRQTFSPVSDWSGGLYVTPTLAGTRSGSAIAGNWAAITKTGRDGFISQASMLLSAAKKIREDLFKIKEVTLISSHDTTIISFRVENVNCAALNDLMH